MPNAFACPPLSRRGVLRLGLTTAALLASPVPLLRRKAFADGPARPHFLVTLFCDGGWDPTQVLDPHDPLDMTDGIDVDVPEAVSGLPASGLASVGGLTYVTNPATRPDVDGFFQRWAGRTAIVNGIATRSTSHDQSKQLVLTGYLDGTKADFSVLAAHLTGPDLPLPHLLVSGQSFGGPFGGLSGRLGGQMERVIDFRRSDDERTYVVSEAGEVFIEEALAAQAALDEGASASAIAGRFAAFRDADGRATKLADLAASLDVDARDGRRFAQSLGEAFRAGLTCSVTADLEGGFDTHGDNTQQNVRWNEVFRFLDAFATELQAQPGVGGGTLLDQTTIVVCSEFGRTPELNGDNGKDHHPYTSMLLVGKNVRGGTMVGLTDGDQEGVRIDLRTGQPSDTGVVLDVTHVVAGMVALVGGNPTDFLPTVTPCTGFVA
jgi:uncharacterized protein (DUF1501 family)